jgi:sugar/nucleoside kinase (ribokinase family)
VFVTLGSRGAVYLTGTGTVRTERIDPIAVEVLDPTGCGDVFGATAFSRLLAGDSVASAARAGSRAAGRNAAFRGAGGLADYLRGSLVTL